MKKKKLAQLQFPVVILQIPGLCFVSVPIQFLLGHLPGPLSKGC